MSDVSYIECPGGERLAYMRRAGAKAPGVFWLGGFKSDMTGTKATALDSWAAQTGYPFVRFDYFGHGQSSGDFRKGTISRWKDDALAVLDQICEGPQVLVGSSMGGWISTLVALERPERVAGIVLIAPAIDMTEELMWSRFPDDIKQTISRDGVWLRPSAYDPEPYAITKALLDDGRRHLILGGRVPLSCPIRILHGMRDPDVPWQLSLRLIDVLASKDVVASFIKDGDHRLSEPADIARLNKTVGDLCAALAPA
jgi:pimeloyl-ACP methyl ester carboxylesterase